MSRLIIAAMLLSANALSAQTPLPPAPTKNPAASKTWPAEVRKVEIPCSDGARQPAMWFAPPGEGKKPLLVGLHTWSSHYASAGGDAFYAEWCIARGWAFIHPHFRGPNSTPDALGSDRAVQDVIESVDWAKQQTGVDESRIYLIGVSGGGHMAMQMAARHPKTWAGVSAWCGIADVAQWYAEHVKNGKPDRYAQNIESALGHAPAKDDPEAWKRSPASTLKAATVVPLDINHGIHDGRKGSVPFIHSLQAFNAVVPREKQIPEDVIRTFYETQRLPEGWPAPQADLSYGKWHPIFRKSHVNTRVTIFAGGHEIVHQAALNWLSQQRKGQAAVWDVKEFIPVETGASESGK